MPQWKNEYCNATRAASRDPDFTPSPGGGDVRCEIGSATPKKTSPTPMPPPNMSAIQEIVANSGFSPALPSGIRPYRLSARNSVNATKNATARMNSQPNFAITQFSASVAMEPVSSG